MSSSLVGGPLGRSSKNNSLAHLFVHCEAALGTTDLFQKPSAQGELLVVKIGHFLCRVSLHQKEMVLVHDHYRLLHVFEVVGDTSLVSCKMSLKRGLVSHTR